jgi:RNA 2',3'-cyclic 3'-phosphodiesterase
VRLFFAIFPDSEMRGHLAAAAAPLPLPDGTRGVPVENYHATLAFLGEVASEQLGDVKRVGARQRAHRFALRLDSFEYWAKAGVVVASASESPVELTDLRAGICASLERCGLELDSQLFRPHVTIARKVSQAPVLQAMSKIIWTPRAFQLARSVSTPDGAIYTVVASWPLLDKPVEWR